MARFFGASAFPIPDQAVSVNVDATTTITTGGALDHHNRATTVVVDGIVVLVYHNSTGHTHTDGHLAIKFSDDYGATWTAENTKIGGGAVTGFPMNPPDAVAGTSDAFEPKLYIAPTGDILLHMWLDEEGGTPSLMGCWQSRSTDGGATWSTPTQIDYVGFDATADLRTFSTDDYFNVGTTMYVGLRNYLTGSPATPSERLMTSTDSGLTWTLLSTIVATSEISATGSQEAGLERVGASTVIAMIRDQPHTAAYQKTSTDMGATWGSLIAITSTVGIAARQRVYTRAHLKGQANWWLDPVVLMVGFVHTSSGDSFPRRCCVWVSRDHGATWSTPFYIDTAGGDGGYGDMFYDPDNDQYVVVNYKGPNLDSADIKQYHLTISGV